MAIEQHDVAGLEIPVQKIIARRAEQELRQAVKIVLQRLFVKGNAGKPEEIVFEIVQIPGNRLAIEAAPGITDFVVQVAAGLDLEARQHAHDFAIGFHRRWSNVLPSAILGKKLEK